MLLAVTDAVPNQDVRAWSDALRYAGPIVLGTFLLLFAVGIFILKAIIPLRKQRAEERAATAKTEQQAALDRIKTEAERLATERQAEIAEVKAEMERNEASRRLEDEMQQRAHVRRMEELNKVQSIATVQAGQAEQLRASQAEVSRQLETTERMQEAGQSGAKAMTEMVMRVTGEFSGLLDRLERIEERSRK